MTRPAPGRLAAALLLLALGTACASRQRAESADGSRRPQRDLITEAEIRQHHFANAMEAVETLRANWLRVRGTDSFVAPSQIWVYYDELRLGGIETLRGINTSVIGAIRYHDGIAASARWGLDHGAGVIQVLSQPPARAPQGPGRDSTPGDGARPALAPGDGPR